MNFKVDDLKTGPKATLAKLNIWAAAIRWILDWIDAQPANAGGNVPPIHRFIIVENGVAYYYDIPATFISPVT